jgi:hypothetical protein
MLITGVGIYVFAEIARDWKGKAKAFTATGAKGATE